MEKTCRTCRHWNRKEWNSFDGDKELGLCENEDRHKNTNMFLVDKELEGHLIEAMREYANQTTGRFTFSPEYLRSTSKLYGCIFWEPIN